MGNDLKLTSVLLEMPMIGQLVSISLIQKIASSLDIKLKSGDFVLSEHNPKELGDGFYYIQSTVGGDMYLKLICLIKKEVDGYDLCFASLLKPREKKIENKHAFTVTFSKKYKDYGKRQASFAYINFIRTNVETVITSDEKMSDAGAGIWMELMTRPELEEDIFVWNTKTEKKEETVDFNQVFGDSEKYNDYIVCLTIKNK
jgi:hypothetical protein